MRGPSWAQQQRRRWTGLLPLFVGLIVVAELTFLGRVDMGKNAAMVRRWTSSFHFPSDSAPLDDGGDDDDRRCEDWLEREDAIAYSRDFRTDPIVVAGAERQDWASCSVGCKFGSGANKEPDAAFEPPQNPATASVLRSMESSHYYAQNNIHVARRRGYNIIMTTSLSSDVPVGYFSWAEYDIMAPMHPKTEDALAAAFISNCGAKNFRLQALEKLEKLDIKIDSYGSCHRNRDGAVTASWLYRTEVSEMVKTIINHYDVVFDQHSTGS